MLESMPGLARVIALLSRHPTALGLAIVTVVGTAVSWVSGLPIWAGWVIALGALLVNGFIILFEDEE